MVSSLIYSVEGAHLLTNAATNAEGGVNNCLAALETDGRTAQFHTFATAFAFVGVNVERRQSLNRFKENTRTAGNDNRRFFSRKFFLENAVTFVNNVLRSATFHFAENEVLGIFELLHGDGAQTISIGVSDLQLFEGRFTFRAAFVILGVGKTALLAGMGVGGGGLLVLYLVFIKDMGQTMAQGLNLVFFIMSLFLYIHFLMVMVEV